MGVIIFTQDDARYRKGDYLTMYGDITINPTAPETTYILHNKKFSEDELIYWASIVPHRMVIVVDKPPKLTSKSEHCVILDQNMKVQKEQHHRSMRAALCWADRDRAHRALQTVPMPLANAFIKVNVNDIELGRLLAKCRYTLHNDYLTAAIAYGISPVSNFKWPSKRNKSNYILPLEVRNSDKYMDIIAANDPIVANEIRRDNVEALPKGVKKRKQKVIEWV